jgi:hypothetical protein
LQPRCKDCEYDRVKNWRTANPNLAKQRRSDRYVRNKSVESAQQFEYRTANKDKVHAATARWKRQNPHATASYNAKRKAAKLQATPVWADASKMEEFYWIAKELTLATGIAHHVDHIVPLISDVVCGLHNQFNLQILPASENMRKRNLHWPDMPCKATKWKQSGNA